MSYLSLRELTQPKSKEYSKKSEYIIPCFGIHPWRAPQFNGNLEELIPYIDESKLIGEIGLDYFWVEDSSSYDRQREIFNFILEESIKRNKVVSLHTKGAEESIYNALKKYNYKKAIIHWYSGEIDTLDKFIELGCYFTISVDIGYSDTTYKILNRIPINRLLIETDGPTALEWVNGGYAYPSFVKEIILKVAKFKGISNDKLINLIYKNYIDLLNS